MENKNNLSEISAVDEIKPENPVWRYIKAAIAAAVIVGIVYLSGLYHYFFYRETPVGIVQPEYESILDAETLTLPLRVFVLTGGELGSKKAEGDILRIFRNAAVVWRQADIELVLTGINFLEKSDEEIGAILDNPRLFLDELENNFEAGANILFVRALRGISGLAYPGLKTAIVADFTSSYDFRVLAHEIGHLLGLPHAGVSSEYLMHETGSGAKLTKDEAITARYNVLGY